VLNSQALTIEELKAAMSNYNDETWVKAFNELIDDGVIKMNDRFYLLS
jgi:hypothetical protein